MIGNNENQTNIPAASPADKIDSAYSRLPDFVAGWLASTVAADNNAAIIDKFNLSGKNSLLAALTGEIILKEILLEKFPEAIQTRLGLDAITAKAVAAETAEHQFLPIRDYLTETANAIKQWGGSLPTVLPPKFSSGNNRQNNQNPAVSESKFASAAPSLKSLREITQENKNILNQTITSTPLKIANFDQPVRGTVKNWLADYIKNKGAGRHNPMERSDYLFQGDNAKTLTPPEKTKVAKILKSYDEDAPLLYNEKGGIILLAETEPTTTPANWQTETPDFFHEPPEQNSPNDPTKNRGQRVINLKDLS